MKVGYCCNVHGGTTLEEVKTNLQRYASAVKRSVCPDQSMPVGLWLSHSAIEDLGAETDSQADATNAFGDWLAERGLDPFTFNGFPLGNFHQEVVKHDVYLPTWADQRRLDYTKKLADVQTMLLARAGNSPGLQTISTLPLGWPPVAKGKLFEEGRDFLAACKENLHALVKHLVELKAEQGCHVVVCMEPEPGCVFDCCDDIVRFFREHLFDCDSGLEEQTRAHIGICHDVCHSAVMFEDQQAAVSAYQNAGIRIGKVQVSSAIKIDFEGGDSDAEKLQQLSLFAEPRYLHQTSVRSASGEVEFFEDLPGALERGRGAGEQWRVHFHVPIFAESLGQLATTQSDIVELMASLKSSNVSVDHFEVETYAWNVLPAKHREMAGDLATGIAYELQWFTERFV